jgi:glycosyltransferase involved in cell wall biosynthesis
VTAVVPTHGRPELARQAVESILSQDYPGALDVIVVHDAEAVDDRWENDYEGRVRGIVNDRTRGLCGARNTGILAATGELIAFCDDDDVWLDGKLSGQVRRLLESPAAVLAATAMLVDFDGTLSARIAGTREVTYADLLRSRMAMLHSSSFLVRRSWLVDKGELLDENLPGSMGEDWDLLLRAARTAPIAQLDVPLVRIRWGSTSFFSRDWTTRLAANAWFLERYPEIEQQPVGVARLAGQNAFFAAAAGDRKAALSWMWRAARRRPTEARVWLAAIVLVNRRFGEVIMGALHRHGRGI